MSKPKTAERCAILGWCNYINGSPLLIWDKKRLQDLNDGRPPTVLNDAVVVVPLPNMTRKTLAKVKQVLKDLDF